MLYRMALTIKEFEINELRAKNWKTTSQNENCKFLLWR